MRRPGVAVASPTRSARPGGQGPRRRRPARRLARPVCGEARGRRGIEDDSDMTHSRSCEPRSVQRCRRRVEEIFGWLKAIGGWRKTRYWGLARNPLGLLHRPGLQLNPHGKAPAGIGV